MLHCRDAEYWTDLHRGGNESARAFETLAGRLWGPLVRMVARRFPAAEKWQVVESVEDALLALRDSPQRFDPGRGVPLRYYLAMTTAGYLRHRLRKEWARRRRERAAALGEEDFGKHSGFPRNSCS